MANKPSIKVKITNKSHVQPKKKIGRWECQLVTFDLPYVAFFYNQKLLIYKNVNESSDFEEVVNKLKDGLSEVLEEFYQLAGKLGKDDDGVFKVMYDDDMDGVEVVEATIDDHHHVGVDDLVSRDEITSMKDLLPYNGILNLEGLHRPLLAVQFTKLHDGLALGIAINHAVVDGTSTWHFMSSWADICNGAQAISSPPFLDRTKARSTRVKLDIPDAPPPPDTGSTATHLLREKLFHFPSTAIEKIKSDLNLNSGHRTAAARPPFSTLQALATHIWRRVTVARELQPDDTTVLAIFANCRKRVDPPMPDSYFGNLIHAIFVPAGAGMLLGSTLEFTAGMIQDEISAYDAAAINKINDEWEEDPIIIEFKDAGMNCVAIGSSPRFKVYDIDFGFGRPEQVRSGSNNRFDGMVYLYPGKSGGNSIDVEISLESNAMDNLEKDMEFLLHSLGK